MYRVLILESAQNDLAVLDKPVARRVQKRIQWLTENFERIKPEQLTGDLSRFFKLRVGDYRVLYKILHDEELFVVHRVNHRREIYR